MHLSICRWKVRWILLVASKCVFRHRLKFSHQQSVGAIGKDSLRNLEFISTSTDYSSEIDRALDNLSKSGKLPFGRRESMPMMGGPRPYSDYGMMHAF